MQLFSISYSFILKWSSVRTIIRHDMYLFTDEVSVGFQVHTHESQTPIEGSSVVLVPTRRACHIHRLLVNFQPFDI